VKIAIRAAMPVDEVDPELEGRLACAHHLDLVDPRQIIVGTDRWDCRLAHADDPDFVGFDQPDRVAAEHVGQQRRTHPPRSPAANDSDRP
jgi:hypothetical protein